MHLVLCCHRGNISGEVIVCSNRSTIGVDCQMVEVNASSCRWNQDGSLEYSGGVGGVHQADIAAAGKHNHKFIPSYLNDISPC